MAEHLTVYEKAMRYDRLHAYFTDPIGTDIRCAECEAANQRKVMDAISYDQARLRELEAENDKLLELCADLYAEMLTYSTAPNYNASVWAVKLLELGVEVD